MRRLYREPALSGCAARVAALHSKVSLQLFSCRAGDANASLRSVFLQNRTSLRRHNGLVLIVDDDHLVRESLRRFIVACGHTVVEASEGTQALIRSERSSLDVALLDLRLPDTDGLTLFSHLRARHPQVLGVIITVFGTASSAFRSVRAGIAEYVEKPFSLPDLMAIVDRLLVQRVQGEDEVRIVSPKDRVANLILRAVDARAIPRNLVQWGVIAGASRGTVRAWCRAAEVHPGRALCFLRGLWAVRWSGPISAQPEDLLGYVDQRSVARFLRASGPLSHGGTPISAVQYCSQQQFLRQPSVLTRVRELLALRHLAQLIGPWHILQQLM